MCSFLQPSIVDHCGGAGWSSRPALTHLLPAHTKGDSWKNRFHTALKLLGSLNDHLDVTMFTEEESEAEEKSSERGKVEEKGN